MDKKKEQLGMNPSTASGRLVKDLLYSFVRDNFSIEHKEPWLDSDNPLSKFFDLENIAYSHLECNIRAARKPNKVVSNHEEWKIRHAARQRDEWSQMSKEDRQKSRRERYERYGY